MNVSVMYKTMHGKLFLLFYIRIDIRNSFGNVAANFKYSEAGSACEDDKCEDLILL